MIYGNYSVKVKKTKTSLGTTTPFRKKQDKKKNPRHTKSKKKLKTNKR